MKERNIYIVGQKKTDIPANIFDKEKLLAEIQMDKKERKNTNVGLGMYVAIDNSGLDAYDIVSGTLLELSKNPYEGFLWAEDFGRVLTTVQPGGTGIDLRRVNNPGSKSHLLYESSAKFKPQEFISNKDLKGQNLIILNDKPVTVEGFVTELVHMTDEVVWNRYLKIKNSETQNAKSFKQAVDLIISEGLSITTLPEDEILKLKLKFHENYSLRLYGSGKINSIPKLMGGTTFVSDVPPKPINLSFNPKPAEIVKVKETEIKGNVGIMVSVTLAKPLHTGHLFLFAIADLVKLGIGGNEINLINNDTGPRVEAMIARLSELRHETPAQTIKKLQSREISINEIVHAYRQRSLADQNKTTSQLPSNQSGILKAMEDDTAKTLSRAGFNVNMFRESDIKPEYIDNKDQILNSGFSFLRTDKGIKILMKKGTSTATGQSFMNIKRLLLSYDSVCVIDSMMDSRDAVDVAKTFGLKVAQVAGVGAGFKGKIGSGTGGELPTINELVGFFGNELAGIARFYILTKPQFSEKPPNQDKVDSLYNFTDKNSLISEFQETREELSAFKQRIQNAQSKLQNSKGDKNVYIKRNGHLAYLPQKLKQFSDLPINSFVQTFAKPKIAEGNEVKGFLSTRSNSYFSQLNFCLETVERIPDLTEEESNIINKIINICVNRLGL